MKTYLRPTEARLRAMREAVSAEGKRIFGSSWKLRQALLARGLVVRGDDHYTVFATPAGRAWLAENDGKGGK